MNKYFSMVKETTFASDMLRVFLLSSHKKLNTTTKKKSVGQATF